ncbi:MULTISPECIES: lysophospholipid acyltransferase family protein [unclassified Polaribacter]|uniref:lysophospholipid acyltransferase family protein n=1 Tax=unclassified Polaribacter TaxID=196858 RepID=UPI0011BFAA54|nr:MULTISPECIES: lysophospholipid acyltransferase family protein [unclassified Polaribacter]TXD52444.1 1-acyl-sn-glycerol-3-phosphate acyltransferase [Polaribacter sp. IC063]TXD61082.1 1-acyl-sn-glycerol-3-phosphate acyltransferase [Polaribacter sp. IC066]
MKFISYILSPIFAFVFFLILILFHPFQWLSYNLFGPKGHDKVVAALNFSLMKSMLLIGVSVKLINKYKLPENASLILVSNHQSTFDIPPMGWFFRKYNPKFVSKIELGKGIPSISYNLKYGGAALIDRKDPKQAITELIRFSKAINKNKWGAAIFPEGTRSRTGEPQVFAGNGLKIITKFNKDGYVVPLTINNSWKVFKYGKYPFGIGNPITITVHEPIKIDSLPFKELLEKTETIIKEHIK